MLGTLTLVLASGGVTAAAVGGATPTGEAASATGGTSASTAVATRSGGTADTGEATRGDGSAGGGTTGESGDGITTAAITGAGRMDFPAPGNHVYVAVDARAEFEGGSFPERSSGTFTIYHRIEQPGQDPLVNWGVFEVDCMTTGGPTATVTGTMVRAHPDSPWVKGFRTGVSLYLPGKGETALLGLAGQPEAPLTPCMAPAPDADVIEGGFHLTGKH